jgi:hypothetical protein
MAHLNPDPSDDHTAMDEPAGTSLRSPIERHNALMYAGGVQQMDPDDTGDNWQWFDAVITVLFIAGLTTRWWYTH